MERDIKNITSKVWLGATQGGFFLLCLRFQFSALEGSLSEALPGVILAAGSFLLAWRLPSAACFAFLLTIPTLVGCEKTALLECPSPISLIFSAMWLGWLAADGLIIRDRRCGWTTTIVDTLITVFFLSLAVQLWEHRGEPNLCHSLLHRAVFGFGESDYYLTSAFLWLQGLFFFRRLVLQENEIATWLRPIVFIYSATMAAFFLFQLIYHIPEADMVGHNYYLPFEDISSFGAIATALLVFSVSVQSPSPWPLASANLACIVVLMPMIILAYSRAAWLASAIFVMLSICLRNSRVWFVCFAVAIAAGSMFVNENAHNRYWLANTYTARLISLVRLENPTNKDSGRIALYRKAIGMVEARPIVGFGVGSFYRTSVTFAVPADPKGNIPDFAHNAWLQIATELGVPVAALFAVLCLHLLSSGWHSRKSFSGDNDHSIPLAVTLALGAYMQTQMTANSLNVYASNQFFFWFLSSAILKISLCRKSRFSVARL